MSVLNTISEPIKVIQEGGKVVMTMSPTKFAFLSHYIGYTYLAGASVVLIGGTYLAIRVGVPLWVAIENKLKGGKS
jgi:hypothetical protein